MTGGDDQSEVWLYILIQDLMGGVGFVTLVFLMTVIAFSMLYSWRLIANHKNGDDDYSAEIISRYAATLLFKVHAATYVAALVVFFVEFLSERLASNHETQRAGLFGPEIIAIHQLVAGYAFYFFALSIVFFISVMAIAMPLNWKAALRDDPRRVAANALRRYARTKLFPFHVGVFLIACLGLTLSFLYVLLIR